MNTNITTYFPSLIYYCHLFNTKIVKYTCSSTPNRVSTIIAINLNLECRAKSVEVLAYVYSMDGKNEIQMGAKFIKLNPMSLLLLEQCFLTGGELPTSGEWRLCENSYLPGTSLKFLASSNSSFKPQLANFHIVHLILPCH